MKFGFTGDMTTADGHKIIIGPFSTRDAAEAAATEGSVIVQWDEPPGPGNPCPDCGAEHVRLPMPEDTAKVYDALYPNVLDWREDDDCGMARLMRDVAEAAAAALRGN